MDYDKLKADLTRDEGWRAKPYKDTVGKLTVGVGHNLTDKGLSPRIIDAILDEDVADAERDLDRFLQWWRQLSEPRQRVLLNMCFNLGIGGLLGFTNTLASIRAKEYEKASRQMLQSKWAEQVGQRAVRLSKMMAEG